MENVSVKERNTAEETNGKIQLVYIPKKGIVAQNKKGEKIAFFQIGKDISELLKLPHEYDKSDNDPAYPNCTDIYSFFDEKFIFWVTKKYKNILWRMRTDISFIFNGYELIGMKFDDFLSLDLLQPDFIRKDYWYLISEHREYFRHYTVYYFCKDRLIFHVWRNKIRSVFVGHPFFENKKIYIRKYDIQEFVPGE